MNATNTTIVRALAVIGLVWTYLACGSGAANVTQPISNNPLPSLVSLSPSSVTAGASDFTLGVTGSGFITSSVVRWNGSNRPTTLGDSSHLNATISAADIANAGMASVSVSNPTPGGGVSTIMDFTIAEKPAIEISPDDLTLDQGATRQFTATVTGMSNTDVAWSVQEGNSGGAVTSTGLYQAPAAGGTFHVVATSQADTSLTATVTVTVNMISVIIVPRTASVVHGGTRTFSATVLGTQFDKSVSWSVQEGAAGGSVTSDGLYTAPVTPATYHVVATSSADPSKSAIAAVQVVEHGFSDTGHMIVARKYHTATRLQNGDVLIAGGLFSACSSCAGENLASAEVFDHTTGKFRQVSSMFTQRTNHTATLLLNGKVLIVGGGNFSGSLGSAELYDPVTETFSLTGEMTVARQRHASTLLPDGKVLVVGGWRDPYDSLSSWEVDVAETYDPATGVFSFAGKMVEGRHAHSATPLPDGPVFVAGGASDVDCTSLSSTEVFDPASNVFAASLQMPLARAFHTATLLQDGRVFLAGGNDGDHCDGYTHTIFSDAEIFDSASQSFISSLTMTSPRTRYTATLLQDGRVLLVGGYTTTKHWDLGTILNEPPTRSAELFDPATQSFVVTGELTVPRAGHAATLLQDGRVLVTGGSGDVTAEIFQ